MRSLLFVPGDSERKFQKAAATDAHGLILDLEDSVPPEGKAAARATLRRMLDSGAGGKALWVRINALDTQWALEDLVAVVPARPFGIMLPKSRSGADCGRLSNYLDALETAAGLPLGAIRILPIATELGAAMFDLASYAGASARLWGLTWGAEDLAADLGASANRAGGAYTEPFRLARSLCLYAAANAGVAAIDTICAEIEDLELLRSDSEQARRDGFAGKMAIHPSHIPVINAAFTPSEAELAWARRVVAAFAGNPGAGTLRLDGKMIDRPHLRSARHMLGLE
ncbi:MAG: CoA ester lyase [Gammaproteobacteria bacterium]|nr:CoA ester lyase [Gammaproteobacteria bacterium]